jgi:hypothetical protein
MTPRAGERAERAGAEAVTRACYRGARRRHLAKGSKRVAGPLAAANREIREAQRRDEERQLAQLGEPRRLTDQLLSRLEELNLDGIDQVPESFEPALAELRTHLRGQPDVGKRLIDQLQPGTSTAGLIETVFSIQEIISPPSRPPGTLSLESGESILDTPNSGC